MILGVDHLSFAGASLAEGGQCLSQLGLERQFAASDLENAATKRGLLHGWRPSHDIAVHGGANGPAIELTVHGPVRPDSHFGFVPILANPWGSERKETVRDDDLAAVIHAATGMKVKWREVPRSGGVGLWSVEGDEPRLMAAVHFVRDIESSGAFFASGLKCQERGRGLAAGRRWRRYAKPSRLPRWGLTIVLIEAIYPVEGDEIKLDSAGFPCLAFLATGLEREIAHLSRERGIAIYAPFQIAVNSKRLKVALLRGPSGEIVELIEIVTPKRG